MTALLQIRDMSTRFHIPEGTVYAVNGVSYDLDEGGTLAIVGESGCGKSVSMLTLLRLIPIPPGEISSGSALYMGRDLLQVSDVEMEHIRGKEISMIFQEPMTALNPVLTVRRQITESLHTHLGMDSHKATQRAIELLDWVGIPDPASRLGDYPHMFSGGMRQRVMIAMALACGPKLLIADEPTTALDVTIQAQIVELVIRLREEMGMSVIWITHDLGIIAGLADRVVVMYAGYIIESASCKEVYSDPRHPYTLGLLGSIPRLDEERKETLTPIEGLPPDLIGMTPSCPFAPRCRFQKELDLQQCLEEMPPLEPVGPGHKIACWADVTSSSPR